MLTHTDIPGIQAALRADGGVVVEAPDGKPMYLVLSRNLGISEPGLLVTHSAGGTFYWNFDRAISQLRLIQGGFGLSVAPFIITLIQSILTLPSHTQLQLAHSA